MSETPRSDNQKKDSIGRDISILVVITLAAGVLLGAAHSITKGPIAIAKERAQEEARQSVMQGAETFETITDTADAEASGQSLDVQSRIQEALDEKGLAGTRVEQVSLAKDASGKTIGYVVACTNPEGYGGDVSLMCGISASDGTLTIEGISFLELTETAGMGMRAKESSFIDQFAGKKVTEGESLVYTKDGASMDNEIDAISGCTVTTTAVTKDVNAALEAVRAVLEPDGAEDGAKAGQEG